MTVQVKYTKLEWQIVEILRAAKEPLTTRELYMRLEPRPRTIDGVQRTAAALALRGLINESKTLDGLERTWLGGQ